MTSIYKKKPFFLLQCQWDTKTVLPKVYNLQSNDPCNKHKAEIHKDDGLLGIEFTLNKTISEFICTLKKLNLDYVTSFAELGNVLLSRYQLTGSKCSTSTSQSLSTQKSSSWRKIAPWLRTSRKQLICS